MDTVLDALVELYKGIVNGVCRGMSEPKEVVVHSCSLVSEPLVDGGCVRIVDVVRDVLGEIADDDIFRIHKHVLKMLDESELDERGGDTDGANEKAHERRRVGRVCDKLRNVYLTFGAEA